jgi:hypothetical protein
MEEVDDSVLCDSGTLDSQEIRGLVQDTFRGRVCQCPVVNGVLFSGDGYTHCEGKPAQKGAQALPVFVSLFQQAIAPFESRLL